MHFEHRIRVNDSRLPGLAPVASDALWQALLLTIGDPKRFRPDLDEVKVSRLDDGRWRRSLRFGSLTVLDEVTVDAAAMRFDQLILAPAELAGGTRSVWLDTPDAERLLIHFSYYSPHVSAAQDHQELQHAAFRSAYRQADADLVVQLRALIESG